MSLPCFVHDAVSGLVVGSSVVLEGDEGRHAAVVRRIRAGEQVSLTDGAGAVATCTVTATDKQGLQATVDEVVRHPVEEPHVTVVQAIPKGDRADLAVEMLTEVGADVIVPWSAQRCVAVWREDRAAKSLARWRGTAREAAKQSRRAWFPEVTEPAGTAHVAALLERASVPVVLHEAASGPIGNLPIPGRGSIVVVVGPEGGISESSSPPSPRSALSRCASALGAAHLHRRGGRGRRTARAHPPLGLTPLPGLELSAGSGGTASGASTRPTSVASSCCSAAAERSPQVYLDPTLASAPDPLATTVEQQQVTDTAVGAGPATTSLVAQHPVAAGVGEPDVVEAAEQPHRGGLVLLGRSERPARRRGPAVGALVHVELVAIAASTGPSRVTRLQAVRSAAVAGP